MSVAFVGATVVDGTGKDPVANQLVLVDGDRITQVGGAPPADADIVDVGGLTLTPGLIDAHVHLGLSSDLEAITHSEISAAEVAANIFRVCDETLDAGFTTVRDVGGIDGGLVRAIDGGLVRGPRVLAAGPLICQTGGHGHYAPEWEPSCAWNDHHVPGLYGLSLLTDGPDEMRRHAREAFRRGASFLKLCVTGGVISKHDALTDTQFTIEEIAAATFEARARGTYVTVHAHNNEGIRNAVTAGVRCVEHGTRLDEETAALMAANQVDFVPTLTVVHTLAKSSTSLPPATLARIQDSAAQMETAVQIARAAGLRIGSGSDLIGPDQSWRGLELVLKTGIIGPMDALVAATSSNAQIIGLPDVGTIEAGKRADLTVFSADPLTDLAVFNDPTRIPLVVKGGTIVKDQRKRL